MPHNITKRNSLAGKIHKKVKPKHADQLLHEKWPYKSKKGTHHLFHMAIPHHMNESVSTAVKLSCKPMSCMSVEL